MGIGTLMVLGGALSGAGGGMARQAEMDRQHAQAMEKISVEQKFQETLENLRSKNSRAAQAEQYNYIDRNNARQTQRETTQSITVANNNFSQQVKLKEIDFANDVAMTKLQGSIQRSNSAAAAQLQNELDKGDISQIFEGGDGFYYKAYKDGRIESTQVAIPPPDTKSSEGGSIAKIRAERGGSEPTPAPKKPQGSEPSKAAPKPAPKGNTYTQADAAATAKKHGVSVDEVHRRMRAAGYKLTAG